MHVLTHVIFTSNDREKLTYGRGRYKLEVFARVFATAQRRERAVAAVGGVEDALVAQRRERAIAAVGSVEDARVETILAALVPGV